MDPGLRSGSITNRRGRHGEAVSQLTGYDEADRKRIVAIASPFIEGQIERGEK